MADAYYTDEIWKIIPIAPDYAASSFGRIRRETPGRLTSPGRILKQCRRKAGLPYLAVSIQIEGKEKLVYVHRLVAAAFHGPPPTEAHVVAHNDGDGGNNRPENLRWETQVLNIADKRVHGTHQFGERHGKAKLTAEDVRFIRSSTKQGEALARRFGVTGAAISAIRKRKLWAWLD